METWVPKETTPADLAFGPSPLSEYLPALKDIPEEFRKGPRKGTGTK